MQIEGRLLNCLKKKLEEDNNNNFNIIMLDIDFFKKLMITMAIQWGDEVIKKVSNHMQDKVGFGLCRSFRMGGVFNYFVQ